MSTQQNSQAWVFYNHETATYDTRDGTKVAAELAENMYCLADVFYVLEIRKQQRTAIASQQDRGRGGDQSGEDDPIYGADPDRHFKA